MVPRASVRKRLGLLRLGAAAGQLKCTDARQADIKTYWPAAAMAAPDHRSTTAGLIVFRSKGQLSGEGAHGRQ